jgi:hypothetical protein
VTKSDDGMLYFLSLTFNPFTGSSAQTPDQTIDRLILDTGGADTLAYNKAFCSTLGIPQADCLQTDPDTSNYPTDYRLYFDFQYIECDLCYFIDQKMSVSAALPPSGDGFTNANLPNAAVTVATATTGSIIYAWNMFLRQNEMVPAYLDYTQGTGFAGLGYRTSHPSLERNNIIARLAAAALNADANVFLPSIGLDLNRTGAADSDSRLWLDGAPEQYRTALQMGASLGLSNHVFSLLDMTLCGHTLVDEVLALIDTATPCTSLPATLFEYVVSWLPLVCEATYTPTTNTACFYDPADPAAPEVLPTLSFRVAAGGDLINIPLDRLLMPLAKSANTLHPDKRRLCLNRDTTRNYVTVGNMALTAVYTQLDMQNEQVGFANKLAPVPSDGQCLPRKQCSGMETSYTGFNGCVSPDCSSFFLFSSTDGGSSCEMSIAAHVVLALGVAVFLALDVAYFVGETVVGRAIKAKIPHLTMRDGIRRMAQQQQQQVANQANMTADVDRMR